MILKKNNKKIKNIKRASKIIRILKKEISKTLLQKTIQDGLILDKFATKIIKQHGGEPAFLGYNNFPNTLCISVNNELIHGIPNNKKFLAGDLISVDMGVKINGYYADSAFTIIFGNIKDLRKQKIIKSAKGALKKVIKILKSGTTINEIGRTIAQYIKKSGLYPIKEYGGHGIGKKLHQEPFIPNVEIIGLNKTLKEGDIICVEPLAQECCDKIFVKNDGWTVVSANNCLNAHFEHTILIKKNGCKVLT